MTTHVLIDLSGIAHPIWHVSGQDPDPDHVSTATIARVRQIASGYDHAVVCCDSRKSFRRELCADYKANREAKPESLFYQIDRAKQVLAAEYPVLESEGFEADDVIATCVRLLSAVEELEEIVVASSDKDLAQLVRGVDPDGRLPSVRILSLATNELRGVIEVRAKFGVSPTQMGDWLALVGDASDNVKGCPGIGDKKASALLTQFGSLVGVYGRLQGIGSAEEWSKLFNGSTVGRLIGGPAVYTALASLENQQAVALARKLVELRTDVPIALEQVLAKPEPKAFTQAQLEDDIAGDAVTDAMEAAEVHPRERGLYAVWQAATAEEQNRVQQDIQRRMETGTMVQQIVDRQTGEVTEVQTQVQVQTEAKPEPAPVVESEAMVAVPPVEWALALEPRTPAQAIAMAARIFNSKFFSAYGNPDAVLTVILAGRSMGLDAMTAIRGMHIIEGKPTLSAGLMVGLVLRSGKAKFFRCLKSTAEVAVYETHRIGDPEPTQLEYTIEEAQKADLVKKTRNGEPNQWMKRPKTMLRHRCEAELAREVYPDIVGNCYTPEEAREFSKEPQ